MKNIFMSFLISILSVLMFSYSALADGHSKGITIVLVEQPDIVDPCEATRSNVGKVIKQNVVETLVEINPADGSIKPRLATSWKQTDNLTWEFKIRTGVKFHDGEPLNAKTAVKSIKRSLDPRSDCEVRTKYFGNMNLSVSAKGNDTIVVKTKKPQPIMPALMGTMTIASPNTQELKGERNPKGTGPYTFAEWTPGQKVVLKRNKNYWGEKPQVEQATYIWRSESAVRAAMVKTGEADIAPNIAVQDANEPGMDYSFFNSETSRLRMDPTREPFTDWRVRLAANLAIDIEGMKGTIFSPDVVPMTQIVVPSINGHNHNLRQYGYDPERAKELLAAAKKDGIDVGKEITMVGRIGIYPNGQEAMEAMHSMLSAVGFNVKIKMMETSNWLDILSKPYAQDRGPILIQAQHDNNNGDAVFSMIFKYHCSGAQSTTCDKAIDEGIEAATVATGRERRLLWQEVQRRLHQDLIVDVQMYHMVGYARVNPRIDYTPTISTNSEVQIATVKFR